MCNRCSARNTILKNKKQSHYAFGLHCRGCTFRYLTGSISFGSFSKFHSPRKTPEISSEARLQFLQEVYSIFSENNLKEYNVRVSCICHCRLQRNALNAINLFALSQTATFSKKFSFRFNSTPTKSDVHKPL